MAAADLISLGIGSPAGIRAFILDGLSANPGASDTIPDAFSFVDQSNVALASTVTSAAITVTGINAAAIITVTSGLYDINGSGSFTTSPGTVNNGDTVRARHTSSGSFFTGTDTVITIGGVADTFTSTTLASDTTPNQFSFTDQTGVALNATVTSAAITIAGINTSVDISITGGTYSINGAAYASSPGLGAVVVGDSITVRHTASASYATITTTILTVGGVSDAFTSTTLSDPGAADPTPPSTRTAIVNGPYSVTFRS